MITKESDKEDKLFLEIFKHLYKFYGPQYWWPAKTKLEVIIGAILTQSTAWSNAEKAIKNLKKYNLISADKLYKIKVDKLAQLIKPSGYYNIKAVRVKNFINFLFNQYQGSLHKMFRDKDGVLRDSLLSIKGLGQETADSILLYAASRPIFVVDAYTKRIFSRHHLINTNDSYQDIQSKFMGHLKHDQYLFGEYHALIVELGKNACRKKPNCDRCPLINILGRPDAANT